MLSGISLLAWLGFFESLSSMPSVSVASAPDMPSVPSRMGMYDTFSTLWNVTSGSQADRSTPINSKLGRSCGSACQHRVAS